MSGKRLVFVFDPLCGWSYGFSPVVDQLHAATRRRADWDVVSGGMVLGERRVPIGRVHDFLREFLPRVESTTGVRFGEGFNTRILEPGTAVLSSMEPSRALQTVKALAPDRSFAFARRLQKALYDEGRDVTDYGTLVDLADEFEVVHFAVEYLKTETHDATLAEFRQVSEWGVHGFPTLLGFDDEGVKVFSRGWQPFERLIDPINRWLDA